MEKLISLEFTTTACNRPDILQRTYSSYCSKLLGIDFKSSTLYLNIDPSPNANSIELIEGVARKYFGNVIINRPASPNFAKAVIWCFSQVKGPYFFHLEDDWNLLQSINISQLISKVGSSNLQCVLNKKSNPAWNKERGEPTFVPSLFSTHHVKKYLALMNDIHNPEYQMKLLFRNKIQNLHSYRSIRLNESIELSKDIGRDWLSKNKLTRNYSSKKWSPWITWKKKN